MKTVSGKKKVPLPQIRISDCHPYVIEPIGCLNEPPYIPFVNPNPVGPKPSAICKVLPQDETYRTFRPVGTDPPEGEVDPVEQVAAFLKKLEENPLQNNMKTHSLQRRLLQRKRNTKEINDPFAIPVYLTKF